MFSNFSKKVELFLHQNERRYQTQVLCHLLPSEQIKEFFAIKNKCG